MRPQREPGVPLGDFRRHQVGVLVDCVRCGHWRAFDLEAVIAGLCRRGLDGETVGIKDAARYIRGACPRCGARQFDARPNWHRLSVEHPCGPPPPATARE